MNKKNIILILTLTFCNSTYAKYDALSANLSPDSFTISTSVGILQGEANEYVYDASTGKKISQLDWQIKSLPILKGDFTWDAYSFLSFNFRAWAAFTSGSGYLDDYDWLVDNQSNPSHHSWHPNTDVNYGNEYDLNVKFWFLNNHNSKLGLVTGYQETRFSWIAYGGSYSYNNGSQIGSESDYRKAIGYSQVFSMPYAGLVANHRIDDFEFNAQFKFSNAVSAHDYDDHYMRSLSFEEITSDSNYYGLNLNIGYYLSKNAKIFTELTYSKYEEGKGETFIVDNTDGSVGMSGDGSAGIANTNYGLTFGIQYQF